MPLDPPPIQDETITDSNRFTQRWILWITKLRRIINETHGWANYTDNQYTSGSPRTINNTRAQITINGLGTGTNTNYAPLNTTWWSNNTFMPVVVGESYVLRLSFKAVPSSPNDQFDVELQIDTGNLVYVQSIEMIKGAGAEHLYSLTVPVYCLDTFLANGGKFFINTSDNIDFYDFSILVQRLSIP